MSQRKALQTHKENRWITASLEICIYFPVVYLKEALSQKENIRFAKQKDSKSSLFFWTTMKKAPRLQRLALCTGMQNRVSGRRSEEEWVKCWLLDWQQGWCWCATLKLCPESSNCWRSRASECYSESLSCFRTELLTPKSIFTCKITPSCSSSKTWWKSVILLETYLHLSCCFLTPQLILSHVFLCNNPLPINMALLSLNHPSDDIAVSVNTTW